MKRTIRLTESELVELLRRVIKEDAPEPSLSKKTTSFAFLFPEFSVSKGKENKPYIILLNNGVMRAYREDDYERVAEYIANFIRNTKTLSSIKKFYNQTEFPLPKFIKIGVGTSSSGTGDVNSRAANYRISFLKGILTSAFDKLGLDSSRITELIEERKDSQYFPSDLDKNLFDPKKVGPDPLERFGFIEINEVKTLGLDKEGSLDIQRGLNSASSMINTNLFDLVDEDEIEAQINLLQTPSDVKDISDAIGANTKFRNLEDFLNKQLFDDPATMVRVKNHLNSIAVNHGMPKDTVRLLGDKISIGGRMGL
jgi:hypothetical protein